MMTEERTQVELPTRLRTTVEVIYPETAELYLANMDNPRKLRDMVVDRYARDMANGAWHVGTSAISFDADGVLRDGQHRLTACIRAGVPFVTVVYRGIGEGAVLNMDRGLKRMWADVLKSRGIPNANNLQSAVVLGWRWDGGLFRDGGMRNAPTHAELEDWLALNETVIDRVHEAVRLRAAIGCVVAPMSAFLHRTHIIDPGASALMVELLHSGDVPPSSPLRKLRDRTMMSVGRRRGGALNQITELAVQSKAWNFWTQDRPMQLLSWRRGPSVRESFPDLQDANGNVYPFPDVVARIEEGDEG